jgi:hypothetical protein
MSYRTILAIAAASVASSTIAFAQPVVEFCYDDNADIYSRGSTCHCPANHRKVRSELSPFYPNITTVGFDCVRNPAVQPKSAQQKSACVTPPAGQVKRQSPTRACVTATNTNGDQRCVYSFTYYLSDRASAQEGGNVGPGKSEERCSLRMNVDVRFGRWTLVGGSAR